MTNPDHKEHFDELLNRAATRRPRITKAENAMARQPRGSDVDSVATDDKHNNVGAGATASKTGEMLD